LSRRITTLNPEHEAVIKFAFFHLHDETASAQDNQDEKRRSQNVTVRAFEMRTVHRIDRTRCFFSFGKMGDAKASDTTMELRMVLDTESIADSPIKQRSVVTQGC
jgi:hypothetical protein